MVGSRTGVAENDLAALLTHLTVVLMVGLVAGLVLVEQIVIVRSADRTGFSFFLLLGLLL